MDINDLTPEQRQREQILFSLKQLEFLQDQYRHQTSPYANTFWIHVTDTQIGTDQVIDLQQLIDDGILQRINVPYQQQGDWRDRFAPYPYLLTTKGVVILNHPSQWVFTGEWKQYENETFRNTLTETIRRAHPSPTEGGAR